MQAKLTSRLAGTLVLAVCAGGVFADDIRWINSAGGSFGEGANWEGGQVPLAGDNAVFDLPHPFTVTLDMTRAVGQVTSTAGALTLDLNGNELFAPNFYVDAGKTHVADGRVAGAGRASGGTLVVEAGADFDRGGGAGNGGMLIIRGTVGKSGDGQGHISIGSNSQARLEGGIISTRRLVVLGRMDMFGGWINGEVSDFMGLFNMEGGALSGEHSFHNGQSYVHSGAVIDAQYSVELHGTVVIEGEGTVVEARRVHGDVTVRDGGVIDYHTTGIDAGGSLTVGAGGVVQRVYCMDGGTLRMEPGAALPRLEAYGSYYTQTAYEVLVDGARSPAFDAVQLSQLWAGDTDLGGTLTVEVVNGAGLVVGQRIPLMSSAGQLITGGFSSVTVPPLDGGRALRVVIEPLQVVLEVIAGGPACGTADFDGNGDTGTDADIEAFFACLAGNCCATCGSADFNADGDSGTDADIEAFFRVMAGGTC
jgi:hypothetical protein